MEIKNKIYRQGLHNRLERYRQVEQDLKLDTIGRTSFVHQFVGAISNFVSDEDWDTCLECIKKNF
jgi:hypothetical protein